MTKIELFKAALIEAANNEAIVKDAALAKAESAQNDEEKSEQIKLAKRALTHETYNAKLAELSESATKVALKYKVDTSAIVKQSRELKKRSCFMLEAIASQSRIKERALDAMLQYVAAKQCKETDLFALQREAGHQTTTQAGYFRTCGQFYGFISVEPYGSKAVRFDWESPFFKALMAPYMGDTASAENDSDNDNATFS